MAWERSAGQVVQVVLTVAVLLAVPSPVQAVVPFVALALVTAAAGVAWRRGFGQASAGPPGTTARHVVRDLRDAPLCSARRAWPAIALASTLVLAGHTATF